jgi:CarD family transcriptional regulator
VSKTEHASGPVAESPIQSPEKSSPAKSTAPVAATPTAIKAPVEGKPAPAVTKPVATAIAKPRPIMSKLGFKLNEYIVYPAHGVGQIISVEIQEVAGFSLELYVVSFIKDKMILKVPTSKVSTVGMRKLAESNIVEKALSTLSGRARIKRTMWSRRAQEYEAKINSGDLVTIAEVVRDLYRSDTQPEQSYSERQLYEAALDRMAREISAVRRLIDAEALKLIESFLQKGPKRGLKSEVDGDGDVDVDGAADLDDADADVDAAA